MTHIIEQILKFFDEIGLSYTKADIGEHSFLPGLKIYQGALQIDLNHLKYPGDLLHEAGHIAVTPANLRDQLTGDMKFLGHTAAEETAAIAWSYAACKYIQLKPSIVFHPDGYKGASQNLIKAFEEGGGFGFPLLHYWGMCEQIGTPEGYPIMHKWFRNE